VSRTADIAEMNPVRNAPETFPGRRDNIVSTPLSWDDATPRGLAWVNI
jgi:hypothetical protein